MAADFPTIDHPVVRPAPALSQGRGQPDGDPSASRAAATRPPAQDDLPKLYEPEPLCSPWDEHLDRQSAREMRGEFPQATAVQHHHAQVLACMAEQELPAPVLGICWDGMGFSEGDTIWGGEFLRIDEHAHSRVGHFRPFPLPGGEAAAREPRRCALGTAYAVKGDAMFEWIGDPSLIRFSPRELMVLRAALTRGVNCPPTTSAGRLFDAVASIAGLRQRVSYEGQAEVDLEFAASDSETGRYPFLLQGFSPVVFDWEPTLAAIHEERAAGVPMANVSARFHNTLAEVIVQIAAGVGLPDVVLTGGCFQNTRLLLLAVTRLREAGFTPHWPHRVPPDDARSAPGRIISIARETAGRDGWQSFT